MPIESPQNPLLKRLRRALESGQPLADGALLAEGPHLLEEALNSAWTVRQVFCASDRRQRHERLLSASARFRIEVTELSPRAFKSLTDTHQDQGIIFLVQPRVFEWAAMLNSPGPLVVLDGIQDPGNAGAIVRSAEAFGASGVAFTEGCVHISNGKLLRAAAGSLFRMPFLENLPRTQIISQLRAADRPLFSLSPDGPQSLFNTAFPHPFALVVGSEGAGVSPLLASAGKILSIPTHKVESLNAAVACAITLFEAARQSKS